MLKQIYKPKVTIAIHLKNGKQEVTDSKHEMIYYKLRYGTLPSPVTKEMLMEEFNLYELNQYGNLVGTTGEYIKNNKGRKYTEFQFGFRYIRYYHDEIEKLVITEEYIKVDIDKVSVELLQKELGFRGYSELLFDRFEELKEEKENKKKIFEEELKNHIINNKEAIRKIKVLRDKSGCPISYCEKVLKNNNWDIGKSLEWMENILF